MTITNDKKVLIVGLGMLGASYAKALKIQGFDITTITLHQEDVDYALGEGFIDRGYTQAKPEVIAQADIVIFALYPKVLLEWVQTNGRYIKAGAFVSDVTGIKCCIIDTVQTILPDSVEFVAAHPMAGREGCGIRQSDAAIFHQANYIVTPSAKNTPQGIAACKELGRLLGFGHIAVLDPKDHDEIIGFVSQLTHCIAITLMTCNDRAHLEDYTGDSFRDLTRIAKINESLWSELFVMNKEALLKQMDLFSGEFARLREMIKTEDIGGMQKMMRSSTMHRALFDKK